MIMSEFNNIYDDSRTVGSIFDAPLIVIGKTWFPLTQIIVWLIMVREAGRLHPDRNLIQKMSVAAMTMPIILGSEWCHNLSHAAAAKIVGHPIDAIRINWGMPLLIYHDIEDPDVSPNQHIIRSLGGPVINTIFLVMGWIFRRLTWENSPLRDAGDAVVGMNIFLLLAGLLPQPWLDGGAVLKWFHVKNGATTQEADAKVRRANYPAAVGTAAGAIFTFWKKKKLFAWLLTFLTAISIGTAKGWFKER